MPRIALRQGISLKLPTANGQYVLQVFVVEPYLNLVPKAAFGTVIPVRIPLPFNLSPDPGVVLGWTGRSETRIASGLCCSQAGSLRSISGGHFCWYSPVTALDF